MKDSEFLTWIAARLVNVYHESENVDFVLKLKELATKAKEEEDRLVEVMKLLDEKCSQCGNKRLDCYCADFTGP